MPSESTTYIGIAFNTAHGFPMQWSIVLSDNERFNGTMLCGTLIDSVNGWVESWRWCRQSLTTLAPYLSVLGIIKVGKVDRPVRDIHHSIFNKVWNAQDGKGGAMYPPTNEFVRLNLLYLCNERTISFPPGVMDNFTNYITGLTRKLQEKHTGTQYSIIPIV
jgi:hypothetical protein